VTKNPYQGDDDDYFSNVRDEETGEIKREAAKEVKEAPKKQTFGQAFAAARKAGDKTFMFGGKKYTTEMKGETKKPAATPKAEPAKVEPAKAEPAKTESSGARQGTFKRGLREFLGIDKEEPVKGVNVPSGATAVERMRKMKEEKYNKKSGGSVSYKAGGSVSASKRADGCAQRGKTRGKVL
jgi:hypothetical protein